MYHWLQRLFSSSKEAPPTAVIAKAMPPAEALEIKPQVAEAVATPAGRKTSATSWVQKSDINAAFTNWLFEGNAYSDIFTNQVENEILAALDKIVKSNQSGANLVRRMPGVIPQLLQSLRTENFSGAQLAKKISNDVVLVGAVIRIANSSFYSTQQSISSIEHAVLVLGQSGLRQLITSVAFQPIIDLQSGHFTKLIAPRLWEQSEKCAVANRLLAQEQQVDPFEAFLAGLIQNVGLLASLRVIDQMSDGTQAIGSESFCNALINYGRILSCSISKEWHFPDSVTQAIADQGLTGKNADISPMGKTLSTGDYLSKMDMLAKHERLYGPLANFSKDLSNNEAGCLAVLNSLKEGEI